MNVSCSLICVCLDNSACCCCCCVCLFIVAVGRCVSLCRVSVLNRLIDADVCVFAVFVMRVLSFFFLSW